MGMFSNVFLVQLFFRFVWDVLQRVLGAIIVGFVWDVLQSVLGAFIVGFVWDVLQRGLSAIIFEIVDDVRNRCFPTCSRCNHRWICLVLD